MSPTYHLDGKTVRYVRDGAGTPDWSHQPANGHTRQSVVKRDGTQTYLLPWRTAARQYALANGLAVVLHGDDTAEVFTRVGSIAEQKTWKTARHACQITWDDRP